MDNATFEHCSAVPMFAPAPASAGAAAPLATDSAFFLTSAHCFEEAPAADTHNSTLVFKRALFDCRLHHLFNSTPTDPLDLALVRCTVVPVAPTVLTVQPYRLQQPAVLLGFSLGTHADGSNTLFFIKKSGVIVATTALHIRFTRLALSMQNPRAPLAAAARVSSLDGPVDLSRLPPQGSKGFVDTSPEQGMSGGAVVDLQCGLLGISESKSLWGVGGSFVLLNADVVARVRAVIAAH